MMCSGVFLTNFKVFHLVMKHICHTSVLSNKRILDGEIEDVKMSSFLSDFLSIFFMNYL